MEGGVPLGCDATMVSALHDVGTPWDGAADEVGIALARGEVQHGPAIFGFRVHRRGVRLWKDGKEAIPLLLLRGLEELLGARWWRLRCLLS